MLVPEPEMLEAVTPPLSVEKGLESSCANKQLAIKTKQYEKTILEFNILGYYLIDFVTYFINQKRKYG